MAKETSDPHSSAADKKRISSAPELPKELARELGAPATEAVAEPPEVAADKTVKTQDAKMPKDVVEPIEDSVEEPAILQGEETDKAVDDIVAHEGDKLLEIDDAMAAKTNAPKKTHGFGRVRAFFAAWWRNKWARWITILVVLATIGGLAAIPKARYLVLNSVGVRASSSLLVLDQTTQLPLKNVTVLLGDKQAKTNVNGSVKFTDMKLGDQSLTIKRLAFAPQQQTVTLGWGSNPLGAFSLKAVGRQYTIQLVDYLSGKPVLAAEATHDNMSALSDKNGKVILTLDDTNDLSDIDVALTASNYRTEHITLGADSKASNSITLVPSHKSVFVTKQSGKYDVYAMDIDGQNKKLLLAGTGRENSNVALTVSPDGNEVALVSTRDDIRDKDGYLMSALTLINVHDSTVLVVDHAEQIQLIDWSDNRVIYQATAAGASASNPQRYRLISYDYQANARSQIAAANQFNAVMSAGDTIYYANSSTDPTAQVGFYKVKPNGTARQRLLDKEVWSGFRVAYGTFDLQTPDGWYAFTPKTGASAKIAAPSTYTNRQYVDNDGGGQSAWVDTRDGKGVLVVYDTGKSKDTVIQTQEGLTYPVRWLSNQAFIYRVATGQETADYAVSLNGGSAKKIADVTNTYGFAQNY
jgi:hypothetical protein